MRHLDNERRQIKITKQDRAFHGRWPNQGMKYFSLDRHFAGWDVSRVFGSFISLQLVCLHLANFTLTKTTYHKKKKKNRRHWRSQYLGFCRNHNHKAFQMMARFKRLGVSRTIGISQDGAFLDRPALRRMERFRGLCFLEDAAFLGRLAFTVDLHSANQRMRQMVGCGKSHDRTSFHGRYAN